MNKTKQARNIAFIAVLIALGGGIIIHGMHLYKMRVFRATKKILPAYVGEYINYDEFADEQTKMKYQCGISVIDTPADDMNIRYKLIHRVIHCKSSNSFSPGFNIGLRDRNKKGNWKVYWIERSFYDIDDARMNVIQNVIQAAFGKSTNEYIVNDLNSKEYISFAYGRFDTRLIAKIRMNRKRKVKHGYDFSIFMYHKNMDVYVKQEN